MSHGARFTRARQPHTAAEVMIMIARHIDIADMHIRCCLKRRTQGILTASPRHLSGNKTSVAARLPHHHRGVAAWPNDAEATRHTDIWLMQVR